MGAAGLPLEDIVYLWRFESLEAWWAARISEETDARLPAFWKRAEALLISRTRRLGRTPSLMTGVEADQTCIKALVSPLPGARRIAVVKPSVELSLDDQQRWVAAAEAIVGLDGVKLSRAGFHVEFSFLPGQMTWDIVATPETAITPERLLAALPGEATVSEFVTLDAAFDLGMRDPVGPLAEKRTIFFRAGDLPEAELTLLEETLSEWTRQLDGLRTWSLARVLSATGEVAWTHCWEQEFDDHRVVTTDYLQHPYHWTIADRLFGPEGPEKSVHEFVHTMRACDRSMLTQMSPT